MGRWTHQSETRPGHCGRARDAPSAHGMRGAQDEKLGAVDRPPSSWRARRRLQRRTEEFRRVYLFLYNLFQFVGFLYIFLVMLIRYSRDGDRECPPAFRSSNSCYTLFVIQNT